MYSIDTVGIILGSVNELVNLLVRLVRCAFRGGRMARVPLLMVTHNTH